MKCARHDWNSSSTMRVCAVRHIGRGRGGGRQCKFVIGLPVTVAHGVLNQIAHSQCVAAQFTLEEKKRNATRNSRDYSAIKSRYNHVHHKSRQRRTWIEGGGWWWPINRLMLAAPADVVRLAVNLLASSRSMWRGRLLGSRNTTARITPWTWSSGQEPVKIRWGRPRPLGRSSASLHLFKRKKKKKKKKKTRSIYA